MLEEQLESTSKRGREVLKCAVIAGRCGACPAEGVREGSRPIPFALGRKGRSRSAGGDFPLQNRNPRGRNGTFGPERPWFGDLLRPHGKPAPEACRSTRRDASCFGRVIYQPPGLSSKLGRLIYQPPGLSSNLDGLSSNPPESRFDETKRKQLMDSLPGSPALPAPGFRGTSVEANDVLAQDVQTDPPLQ